MHKRYYIDVCSIISFGIIYYAYAISQWSAILNITFIFLSFGAAIVSAFATVIDPLTSMYGLL